MPWFYWTPEGGRRHNDQDDEISSFYSSNNSVKSGKSSKKRRKKKKALKDEIKNQSDKKNDTTASERETDIESVRSSHRGRRSRSLERSRSERSSSRRSSQSPQRRSRSQSRSSRERQNEGYWTFVPDNSQSQVPPPPVYIQQPTQQVYLQPKPQPTAVIMAQPPRIYSKPQPIIYQSQQPQQSRVYLVQSQPSILTNVQPQPSKPDVSVFIQPKRSIQNGGMQKANVYIVGDEEGPLRRSHLSTVRRSHSLRHHSERPRTRVRVTDDIGLNESLSKMERSADQLRSKTRNMYRGVRDEVYRSAVMAQTM